MRSASAKPKSSTQADLNSSPHEVVEFPIDEIVVGERVRRLNESAVRELAESIQSLGLLHPITLTTDGKLIAGLHRLEACRLLGFPTVPARLVCGEDDELELLQIDENLIRAELTVLERAEHLERRRELYEKRHPESRHGHGPGRGHVGPQEDRPPGFAQATSLEVGQSAGTIRRHLQIVKQIPLDVRDLIRESPVANSWKELRRLGGLPKTEQRKVAKRIGSGEVGTVWEAQRLV